MREIIKFKNPLYPLANRLYLWRKRIERKNKQRRRIKLEAHRQLTEPMEGHMTYPTGWPQQHWKPRWRR